MDKAIETIFAEFQGRQENLIPILQRHLDSLLCWFSQYVYERLLGQARQHELVRLQQCLDVTPLVAACAAYHHQRTVCLSLLFCQIIRFFGLLGFYRELL